MTRKTETIKVFTGSEVDVALIKGELEENGIPTLIQNEFQSATLAGFGGGAPSVVDVYILLADQARACDIIDGILPNRI